MFCSSDEPDKEKVLKWVLQVEHMENPNDYIPTVLAKVKRNYIQKTFKVSNDWHRS